MLAVACKSQLKSPLRWRWMATALPREEIASLPKPRAVFPSPRSGVQDVAESLPSHRCFAYCVARHFDAAQLVKCVDGPWPHASLTHHVTTKAWIYCRLISHPSTASAMAAMQEGHWEVFFFPREGGLVAWNANREQEKYLLDRIRPALREPYDEAVRDQEEFRFVTQSNQPTHLQGGECIVLGPEDACLPDGAKLAFSHCLARSTQLGSLENRLDRFLHSIEAIPRYLIAGQEPPLTANDVLRKHGHLLHIRGLLNLHSDMVDRSPELYWSRADLESHFDHMSRALDMSPRIATLNRRLDYANRLMDLMREQLTEKRSTRLELIIIALIAVEVGFEVVHYLDRYGAWMV